MLSVTQLSLNPSGLSRFCLFQKLPHPLNIAFLIKQTNQPLLLIILELRDYCDTARDCREFAYICNRNLCECAEGYKSDEKNKTCVGGKKQLNLFSYLVIGELKVSQNMIKEIYSKYLSLS